MYNHLYRSVLHVYKHFLSRIYLCLHCAPCSLSVKSGVFYSKFQGLMMEILQHLIRIKSTLVSLHLTVPAITSSATQFTKIKSARLVLSLTWVLLKLMSFLLPVTWTRANLSKLVSAPALNCGRAAPGRRGEIPTCGCQHRLLEQIAAISDSHWLRGRALRRQIEGG